MALTLSDEQIRLLRLRSQGLVPREVQPLASPEKLLEEICGVQAQELPAGQLAMRAREEHLSLAEIERARQEQRAIVRTWGVRGTLHLITAKDARWLIPFLGPAAIANGLRRLYELGWTVESRERGLLLLQAALSERGELTRPEIISLLRENDLPSEGQAPVHLIYHAAMECKLCLGPDRGKNSTYVLFENWIGSPQFLPRETALAELARRYLSAYAPASPADFSAWSGLKMSEAREGWKAIEDERIMVQTAQGQVALLKSQQPWIEDLAAQPPVLRLLPRFDDTLLGYVSRELAVDPAYARRINAGGGIIHPTLNVNGRVYGVWKTEQRREKLEIRVELFEKLPEELMPELEKEAASIGCFLEVETSLEVSGQD